MNELKNGEGTFVWRELMSTNLDAALAFYAELFGWSMSDSNMPDMRYLMIGNGGKSIGGMMSSPPDMPFSAWMSYVMVTDVDATVKRALEAGGQVVFGPVDLEGVGRMATILDNQQTALVAFCPSGDGEPPQMPPPPGAFCWETLNVQDLEKAHKFHTSVYPWKVSGPESPFVTYIAGETAVADIEKAPEGVPSHWLVHVVVESVAIAREKAVRLGATVLVPEIPIPGVGVIAIISDPTGAALSLFESEKR